MLGVDSAAAGASLMVNKERRKMPKSRFMF